MKNLLYSVALALVFVFSLKAQEVIQQLAQLSVELSLLQAALPKQFVEYSEEKFIELTGIVEQTLKAKNLARFDELIFSSSLNARDLPVAGTRHVLEMLFERKFDSNLQADFLFVRSFSDPNEVKFGSMKIVVLARITQDMLKLYPDTTKTVHYFAMASGDLLFEYLLLKELEFFDYRSFALYAVDPIYSDMSIPSVKAFADQFQKDGFKVLKQPKQPFSDANNKTLGLYIWQNSYDFLLSAATYGSLAKAQIATLIQYNTLGSPYTKDYLQRNPLGKNRISLVSADGKRCEIFFTFYKADLFVLSSLSEHDTNEILQKISRLLYLGSNVAYQGVVDLDPVVKVFLEDIEFLFSHKYRITYFQDTSLGFHEALRFGTQSPTMAYQLLYDELTRIREADYRGITPYSYWFKIFSAIRRYDLVYAYNLADGEFERVTI